MPSVKSQKSVSYIRNFTFGVEDSLASTVGLLSGISSANISSATVVLTGLVLIFTEALSMAVGSFLSEQSVQEFEHHRDLPLTRSLPSAFVMFFSYLVSGLVPIFPYSVLPMPYALYASVVLAVIGLMFLGVFNSMVSKTPLVRQVKRMFILGGCVAVSGILAGKLLEKYVGTLV